MSKKSKQYYEELIRNTTLFTLDKEKQRIAYMREYEKLIINLYSYWEAKNSKTYCEFGVEIVECAKYCIENFDPQKGEFINYFNYVFGKESDREEARRDFDKKHMGVRVSDGKKKLVRNFMEYMRKRECYSLNSEIIREFADSVGIDPEKMRQLIADIENIYWKDGAVCSDDGTETELLLMVQGKERTDEHIMTIDNVQATLEHLNDVFVTRQKRQRGYLGDMITSRICRVLESSKSAEEYNEILMLAKRMDFFAIEIYEEFRVTGILPEDNMIADKYGMSPQSLSRAYKDFKLIAK